MSESSGHEVGQLFLRVTPILDQAAMQRLTQQAQAAANAAGGSGRTVGGGPGIGRGNGGGGGSGWFQQMAGNGGGGGMGGGPPGGGGGVINNVVNNAFSGPAAHGYGGSAAGGFMGPDGMINPERNFWSRQMWEEQMGQLGTPMAGSGGGGGGGAKPKPGGGSRWQGIGRAVGSAALRNAFLMWEYSKAEQANTLANEKIAMGAGPLLSAKAKMAAYEEQTGGLVGSIKGWWNEHTSSDAAHARFDLHGMEEEFSNRAAAGDRDVLNRQDKYQRAGIYRESWRMGLRGIDQARQAARDTVSDAIEKNNVDRLKLMNAVDKAKDTGTKGDADRAQKDLDLFNKNSKRLEAAVQFRAAAQYNADSRDFNIAMSATRREGRVYQALGIGDTGTAEERGFENSLADRADRAAALGGAMPKLMAGINGMAASARRGLQDKTIGGPLNSSARFYSALSRGDEMGAMREQQSLRRQQAIDKVPGPFKQAAGAAADAQSGYEDVEYYKARGKELSVLGDRYDRSAFLADKSRPMWAGAAMADANQIYKSSMREANDQYNLGDQSAGDQALATGRNELAVMKRQLLGNVGGSEVSVNRFAAGGGDVEELLRQIENNTRGLGKAK